MFLVGVRSYSPAWSPRSPCPGGTLVLACLRTSCERDLPTSETSSKRPFSSRRTNRLSRPVSISSRLLGAFFSAIPPPSFGFVQVRKSNKHLSLIRTLSAFRNRKYAGIVLSLQ